jgi:hypothetical protein
LVAANAQRNRDSVSDFAGFRLHKVKDFVMRGLSAVAAFVLYKSRATVGVCCREKHTGPPLTLAFHIFGPSVPAMGFGVATPLAGRPALLSCFTRSFGRYEVLQPVTI